MTGRQEKTDSLKLEPQRRKELQSIVEAVSGAIGGAVSLWVLDEEKQTLKIAAAVGVRPSYIKNAILFLDKPSVEGDCFVSGQPVTVLNVTTDPRWKYKNEAVEMGWRSVICVPVRVHDEVVGVLSGHTFVARSFSPFEQQLLTDYASQVGHTVESERSRQTLRRLLEVTRTIEQLATRKPHAILKQIVNDIRNITRADCVVLYPFVPSGDSFESDKITSSGLHHPLKLGTKPRRTGGMAAYVKEQKEIIVNNILEERPDMLDSPFIAREGVRAFMGIALETAEHVEGILYVDFRSPHKFQEQEIDIIRLFGRQIATSMHNARLFEQATDRATVLQKLHQIGEQLFSAEPSARGLKKVLRQVARGARTVLGADLVDIYQYIKAEGRYILPPVLEGKRRVPSVVKEEIFEDDVVGSVIRGQVPLYFVDTQTDSSFTSPFTVERPQRPDERFVVREDILSSAAVPLKAAGETVGVMFVNYRTRQAFTFYQKEIIELFANQAAVAIYNARVYEQVQKRIKALEALNQVGQRLSTVEATRTGLGRLLRQVAQQAKKVLDADLVELYRYSRGKDRIVAHVVAGKKLVDVKPLKVISPDDIATRVLNQRQPLFANDVQHDPLLSESLKVAREGMLDQRFVIREQIASTAAVPLIVREEAVGILFVNYRTPQMFPTEQQELIQLFANQAAIAIYNAQLFQQRETLQSIARDITSVLDGGKLLQRTLERSLELLNCDFGSISVYDPTTDTLQFQYAVGKPSDESVKLGEGLIGTAAKTRKSVRVGNVLEDERCVSHVAETRSELDVPMLVGRRLIGVLNAESMRPNAFSEADQSLAEALAAQAAVAFHTAELYEDASGRLQERIGDIQTLQDIYALIGIKPLQDVLARIAEAAARLTPAKYTGIWLLDEQARELRFGAMNREAGTPTQEWPRLPLDEITINAHVALTAKTYLCNDVRDDPYYRERYQDVRSQLVIPLVYGGRVIGTLSLESTELIAFTRDHVRLVEALSGAAAVAIQSARLYDRLDTLARVGQTVTSTLNLDEVLDHIVQESVEALGANCGTLRLLDGATGKLELRAYRGDIADHTPKTIPLEHGIAGWIPKNGEPLLVQDVQQDARYFNGLERTRSELAVPIKLEDKPLGILTIEHLQPYAFAESDLHLLEAIASQVATAIHNAQLYEELEELDRRKSEFLSTVSHELRTPLTPIKSCLDNMLSEMYGRINEKQRARLEMALASVNDQVRLIENLLDLVRIQEGRVPLNLEPESITNIIRDIIQVFEYDAENKHITLRLELPSEDELATRLDRGKIKQVLSNLVHNAIKFTPRKGQVTISASSDDKQIKVQVADTGIGIPESKLEKIFDRFYQVDSSLTRSVGGTGIGLNIVKEYVELHCGEIWVESKPDEGSTFTFTLPRDGGNKVNG